MAIHFFRRRAKTERAALPGSAGSRLSRPRLELLEPRCFLDGDAVIEWNNVLLDAIRTARTPPPSASRAMAIVHTAVYDAVNAIDRTHEFYAVETLAAPTTSRAAAVAGAAHRALTVLFPTQTAAFDAALAASLALVPDGAAETSGVALGAAVANRILELRASDGSAQVVVHPPGDEPGEWRPTAPGFQSALLPQWGDVTPWAISSPAQVAPPAPPALTSAAYADAVAQVRLVGASDAETADRDGNGVPDRTAEQTAIARFWANGAGTATPPGHWNEIAQSASLARGLSLSENARMFALLNIAQADAAIACWNCKFDFNLWRPIDAVRQGDTDGNAATVAEAGWSPLLVTPPFPAYTSGHSTFSAAAAAALADFFGADNIAFTVKSEDPQAGNRSFTSFSQAAAESGLSRIYGGIHFSFDNVEALASGAKIGQVVANGFLDRTRLPAVAGIVAGVLVVRGTEGNDALVASRAGANLIVRSNGARLGTFALSGVNSIEIDGREGNDRITIASSIRVGAFLDGGAGADRIAGGGGNDQILGGDGNDVLRGGRGDDTLDGGLGHDFLFGELGRDALFGREGDDSLFGGPALDLLDGGPGRNRLRR